MTSKELHTESEGLESPRTPLLPPISPRLDLKEEATSSRETLFFMDRNIDGLPERNMVSPVGPSSVRVSVIKPLRDPTESPRTQSVISRVSDVSPGLPVTRVRLTRIPTFYEDLLPVPVLSSEHVEKIQLMFSQLPDSRVTKSNSLGRKLFSSPVVLMVQMIQ